MLLFFTPVFQISRTDDRKKANKDEQKRIAIVHAKFDFAENTHYFAHLWHSAYSYALLARHYCAYNCMEFMARNTRYNAGDLSCRYCAFGGADFTERYCAFSDTNFYCRYCRYNVALFEAFNFRYNVAALGIPLYRQS